MRRSMVGRWLLVAAGAAAATECPTSLNEDAGVRLAGYVVSRRRDVDVRDAIRRTWCATARRIASEEVSVIVRFFVGLDTVEEGDDAHASDVTRPTKLSVPDVDIDYFESQPASTEAPWAADYCCSWWIL